MYVASVGDVSRNISSDSRGIVIPFNRQTSPMKFPELIISSNINTPLRRSKILNANGHLLIFFF